MKARKANGSPKTLTAMHFKKGNSASDADGTWQRARGKGIFQQSPWALGPQEKTDPFQWEPPSVWFNLNKSLSAEAKELQSNHIRPN